MFDLIFNNYIWLAFCSVILSFSGLVLGLLITVKEGKAIITIKAVVVFLALVALGMSNNIKNLDAIGIIHALIAYTLAWLAVKHINNAYAKLLFVPCILIGIVVLFNMTHTLKGLEFFGRWINA